MSCSVYDNFNIYTWFTDRESVLNVRIVEIAFDFEKYLTRWAVVTDKSSWNRVINVSWNSLSLYRWWTIAWTNAVVISFGPLGKKFT